MDYYSWHYVKLSSPTHLQNARFSNQEGHTYKKGARAQCNHKCITKRGRSDCVLGGFHGQPAPSSPCLHCPVFLPPPSPSNFPLTNSTILLDQSNSSLQYFGIHPHPRLFTTTKAFLTFLSAPRPTSIFGFMPLKYNLLHLLQSLFE